MANRKICEEIVKKILFNPLEDSRQKSWHDLTQIIKSWHKGNALWHDSRLNKKRKGIIAQ